MGKLILYLTTIILLSPKAVFSNPAVSFIPYVDETIIDIFPRAWLLILVIIIEAAIHAIFVNANIFKLVIASGSANIVSTIPGVFFGAILAVVHDLHNTKVMNNLLDRILWFISSNIYFLENQKFYTNLAGAMMAWLVPMALAFGISIFIENRLLRKMYENENINNIFYMTLFSNIASYIFLYSILFVHYYKKFSHFALY